MSRLLAILALALGTLIPGCRCSEPHLSEDSVEKVIPSELPPTVIVTEGSVATLPGETVSLRAYVSGGMPAGAKVAWRQIAGPFVALVGADSLTPTFVAPPVSELKKLEFEVTLTTSNAANAVRTESVFVYPTTILSVSAGQDQDVLDGSTTLLHAELLAGGDPGTTFVWRQTGGRIAEIVNPNALVTALRLPRLNAPNPGKYEDVLTFEVTALPPGGGLGQAKSLVNMRLAGISVSPSVSDKAVVDRGYAYVAEELHLSAGVRNARAPINATWVQVAGPNGAILASRDRVETPVILNAAGIYKFEVKVTDALGREATGEISVNVKAAPPAIVSPQSPVDSLPPSQPLPTLQVTSAGGTGQGVSVFEGQKDVSAAISFTGGQGPVTVTWSQLKEAGDPTLKLVVDASKSRVSFDAPAVNGNQIVRLQATITDGTTIITRIFRFLIQDRPINVQLDQVADGYIGKSIDLNGRVTGGFGALTHTWTQVSNGAPDVSSQFPAPGSSSGPHAHIVPTLPGLYVFQLDVTDVLGNSKSEQLRVSVGGLPKPLSNSALKVMWPPPISFVEGETASVGIAVSGAKGPVTVNWSIADDQGLRIPVTLVPKAADPKFVSFSIPAVSSDTGLRLQAVVSDGNETVASSGPLIPIINRNVTVNIIPPLSTDARIGQSVTLSTKASGTFGTARYQWTVLQGKGTLSGANTATATLTPNDAAGDTLKVTLTDDLGNTASDQITVKALLNPLKAEYTALVYKTGMPSDTAASLFTAKLNVAGGSGRYKITHQPTARLWDGVFAGFSTSYREVPLAQIDASLRPEFINSDFQPGFKLQASTLKTSRATSFCAAYTPNSVSCEVLFVGVTTQVTDEITGETRQLQTRVHYQDPVVISPPPDLSLGCSAASKSEFDAIVASGGIVKQYQCIGPAFLCEKLAEPQDCPADKPYGLLVIDNKSDASRSVDRRCASKQEVESGWFNKYSNNDRCTQFDFGFVYTNDIYCEIGYGHQGGNGAGTTPACGSVGAMVPWKP